MCTWFYADYKSLENYITRARKSPLANEIMLTMSRSTVMTGDIRPTDVAAVIASGRSGNMGVFPMVWGFTTEASSKPIKRTCGESHGIPAVVRYLLPGITSGAFSLLTKDTIVASSVI